MRFKTLNYVEFPDLAHDVIERMLKQNVLDKYDETKCSLNTWLHHTIFRIIHNITRRHYYSKDGKTVYTSRTKFKDNSSSAENCAFFLTDDTKDINRIIDAKRVLRLAKRFFSHDHLDILIGEAGVTEVARKNGISRAWVHAKLNTEKLKFKKFLQNRLKDSI